MSAQIHIGTSGWHYKHWLGTFYPEKTKPKDQFAYFKDHFNTVELNNSFYRLPDALAFDHWESVAPEKFLYAVKASRTITHLKKFHECEELLSHLLQNAAHLKDKLGPILFQLPPNWKLNYGRLASFIGYLPQGYRYAFEFRNHSWYVPEIYDLLSREHCTFCIYELEHHVSPIEVTTDFVYVRLHGPEGKYQGNYDDETLSQPL